MAVYATSIVLEAELAGVGGGWTDLSDDVRITVSPVSIEYGIQGSGPLDRIADPGTMQFALDNSSRSSGGLQGYYTPGHANCRSGFELGIAVRLRITYGGTTYYKFRGTLISIQPDAGQYRRQAVECLAVDWMDEAARTKIHGIATQTSKRADQLIHTIVTTAVTRQPAATSYATGQSTFAYALDNMRDDQTSVLRALADCVHSEWGFLYVKGDTTQGGTLRFESRHSRPLAGAAVASFNNSMFELVASRSRDNIINRALTVVHPRKIDPAATTVLYELTSTESVPFVGPSDTLVLTGLYRESTGRFIRIGGDAQVNPVATTDYLGNAAEDGSGADLTASLSVTAAFTSNVVTFTITNNHASSTIYITKLQVRGKGLYDTYETMLVSEDSASKTAYGETTVEIDMPYEDDVNLGKGIADWTRHVYKDPRYVVEAIAIRANVSAALMTQALSREPGDKIAIAEAMTGIALTDSLGVEVGYFINGVGLHIEPGGIITATWTLSPASAQNFWILDQVGASELGVSTVLGYA